MPITRRLPKRGFTNPFRVESQVVRLDDLDQLDAVGDHAGLARRGRADQRRTRVRSRCSRTAQITQAVTVRGLKVSAGAREKIVAAGGRVEE